MEVLDRRVNMLESLLSLRPERENSSGSGLPGSRGRLVHILDKCEGAS